MIYLDNPFGTGFSWSNSTNFITTTELAADYFAEFLAEFFKAHQELVKCRFYIFGESYGGHYVPVFAAKIFEDEKVKSIGLNFKGIAIGDGLVDL
jgi:carboxypeptidase C (cathepsin A)